MKEDTLVRWLLSAWIAGVAYIVGLPQPIKALVILMFAINLPLGWIALVFKGGLTLKQFAQIGLQKLASLFFLGACHLVEPALNLGPDFHVEQKIAYLFLAHEFLAAFRYASACGVNLPAWLSVIAEKFASQTEIAPKPQSQDSTAKSGN